MTHYCNTPNHSRYPRHIIYIVITLLQYTQSFSLSSFSFSFSCLLSHVCSAQSTTTKILIKVVPLLLEIAIDPCYFLRQIIQNTVFRKGRDNDPDQSGILLSLTYQSWILFLFFFQTFPYYLLQVYAFPVIHLLWWRTDEEEMNVRHQEMKFPSSIECRKL